MFGKKKPEVLVVGAGPVGLLAALVLAKRGIEVEIVDKEWRPAAHSYALALHAESLGLFEELGLLGSLLEKAYRVETVGLYDGAERHAAIRLSGLPKQFPFLAVMRQDVLETVLEDALRHLGVKVLWNHRVARIAPEDDRVAATIDRLEKGSTGYAVYHTEWMITKTTEVEVPFVIGADGHLSEVRRALQLDFPEVGETQHFAVFEFQSDADLQHEMRIVLDDHTTNVLWPLPYGRCRWSFQLLDLPAPASTRRKTDVQLGSSFFPAVTQEHLHALIAERAPWFEGSIDRIDWRIVVRFERHLASAFGGQRMWLAGDAGHMTGPVGIQSMNVGLREAHDLAVILADILRHNASTERLQAYNRERTAEWRHLLGLEGGLQAGAATDPWISGRAERLLPCLPASGDDLALLAEQLGLDVCMATS